MTLGSQEHILIYRHEHVRQCDEVYVYVTHMSTSGTQMTFDINKYVQEHLPLTTY